MRRYRITITDSENKHLADWKEIYADTAKDAAGIIETARRGDLDQIEVEEWIDLISEYRTRIKISPAGTEVESDVAVANAIRRAATKGLKYGPQARYDAKNTRQIRLKLNLKTDADVLEWLGKQESMQGAIKELIRAKIREELK